MILSDLHNPFCEGSSEGYDWHQDRTHYTKEQIGEMPTWIKNKKEICIPNPQSTCQQVSTATFSEMRNIAYNVIRSHSEERQRVTLPYTNWRGWDPKELSH